MSYLKEIALNLYGFKYLVSMLGKTFLNKHGELQLLLFKRAINF
jgi:hypothetical protein